MSIEARVRVIATFVDEKIASQAELELKNSLIENDHELAQALNAIYPVANQIDYKDELINVEKMERNSCKLTIDSYTYTSEHPVWFVKSLAKLGAEKIHIIGSWDGNIQNYYFLSGSKVPKKKFFGESPENSLSAKNFEIGNGLFLPNGRVKVRARLISNWAVGDIYESTGMEFKTLEGDVFFYKGRGVILDVLWNSTTEEFDTSVVIEFSAVFEVEKKGGQYASFAKRPTKVVQILGL